MGIDGGTKVGNSALVRASVFGAMAFSVVALLLVSGQRYHWLEIGSDTANGYGYGYGYGAGIPDQLPPSVVAAPDRAPNANGWYRDSVTVSWTVTDPAPSSGISEFPPAVAVTAEGANQPIGSAPACDAAGNCATAATSISIDRTPPTLALHAPADGSSVRISDYVAPTCDASDSLSGLDGVCRVLLSAPIYGPGTQRLTATATATDRAGNTSTKASTYTVVVDLDAPQIIATPDRAPNSNGWYDAAVTHSFSCTDVDAGVALCPTPVTTAIEGADQSFQVAALDQVGNIGTLVVSGINIDKTPPTIATTGTGTYGVADTIVVGCTATDALSGIDTSNCAPTTVLAASLPEGDTTYTRTASDRAGNSTTVTITVTVDVTAEGIGDLVETYLPAGSGSGGFANALAQLDAGHIDSFIKQVNAQCCAPARGKRLTREQADTLIRLAKDL